jgi:ABC-2 type transport system permease protein
MIAIYKREVASYFQSMIGCIFVAFLVAFTGIYFMAYNLNAGYPYFSYTLSGALIVFLVGIPLITMRSFSEEQKTKTDQLLFTAPVPLWKVVLGKYFAMVTVLAIPNLIFCLFPLIISTQGVAYFAVDYLSILMFFLLGCVYLAIGMFLSSFTESQMIAFLTTFGVLLVSYLWDGLTSFLPSIITDYFGTALDRLALANYFMEITSSRLLDLSGLVLYFSMMLLFVFLTIQKIQKRRWA